MLLLSSADTNNKMDELASRDAYAGRQDSSYTLCHLPWRARG